MSLRDDINIPVIVVLGVTTALIVAVAIVGTEAGYNYVTQLDLSRNYASAEQAGYLHYGQKILEDQSAKLKAEQVGWADVDKASVRLPMDRARALMIESKGKTKSATPPASGPASQPKK